MELRLHQTKEQTEWTEHLFVHKDKKFQTKTGVIVLQVITSKVKNN